MILTADELKSLVGGEHRSLRLLLGMNPLGYGSGVVVRTIQPGAKKVEVIPTHEKDKPRFELKRIHDFGLFEGTTKNAKAVYAYDLAVTFDGGATRQARDAYSFLPTL